jgi:hypothetical protein
MDDQATPPHNPSLSDIFRTAIEGAEPPPHRQRQSTVINITGGHNVFVVSGTVSITDEVEQHARK